MIKYIIFDNNNYPTGRHETTEPVSDPRLFQVSDYSVADGKMRNGAVLVDDDRTPEIIVKGITKDALRKRFSTTTLMKLDKLEAHIENDVIFDSLCPNVTPETRELYRDGMRTAFKNLYSDDLIHLDHPIAITGVTLFSDAGAITEAEKTTVLDTSTL